MVASDLVGDTGFHGQGTVTSFVGLHILLFDEVNQRHGHSLPEHHDFYLPVRPQDRHLLHLEVSGPSLQMSQSGPTEPFHVTEVSVLKFPPTVHAPWERPDALMK